MVKTYTFDKATILVGQNAKDNDRLWKQADAEDVWLHLKDLPSPHAIICVKGHIHTNVLHAAAELVKLGSKEKCAKKSTVIYCPVSNLKATTTIGMVKLRSEPQTISV
jgi:predicted ribosome quality control (RQC) complex YloA/Tae2 family protein